MSQADVAGSNLGRAARPEVWNLDKTSGPRLELSEIILFFRWLDLQMSQIFVGGPNSVSEPINNLKYKLTEYMTKP